MTTSYENDATEDGVIKVITVAEGEQQESVPEAIELNGLQPGAWLKQLREQKKLSLEHVADRLYLDTGIVTALEESDYSALPPPIFVRGYIRNYAKLLEVPSSDDLVSAYNAVQPDESLPLPMITPKMSYGGQVNTVNSKDWRVQIFTYLFFLGVAALLVLGGIRTFSNKPAQDENVMELPEITTENNNEQVLMLPPTVEEISSTTDENTEETATENVDSVTISLTSTDDEDTTEEEAEEAEPTFTAEQLHTVVVNYRLDSWTRIIDNTGEKVYEGIAKAGRSITVTGEPPFRMRFGVVEGVTVEYKNERIDVESHPARAGRSFVIGDPLPDTV